jgi:putative transposase
VGVKRVRQPATDEQIIRILRGFEEGGQSVRVYCREKEISVTTFYNWKKRFGTMEVTEVRQLRALERENTRLKRLLAERDLEIDVVKEALRKKW